MANAPSPAYLVATIVAAVSAVVGVWLPWVRKRPVGYRDGRPIYTTEYVSGMETGLRGIDPFVVLLVVAVVGVAALSRYRAWRPDIALVGAGGVVLWVFGAIFRNYRSVERYDVEIGLYLLLASGFLFVLIGAGAPLKRRLIPSTDHCRDGRTG
ncbi:hypothetical protein [Haloterrigena salinisoli]|uniref:hypothetical protein n=1 Tax=Haloterrigena salinisoli TaxID=3132747 RepID=UPI0030D47FC2